MTVQVASVPRISDVERWKMQVRTCPALWFESFGAIKPKVGPLLKSPELKANYLQRLESDVVEWCLLNERPCRLLKLKPRQKGSSTGSVCSAYRYLGNMRSNGAIIGGAHAQSTNLLRILKTYAENDSFMPQNPCKVLEGSREARWANGSLMEQLTAKNGEAGRASTYQVVIATEVARWAEEGVANAEAILTGLLKCVANAPFTLIELESTANGASGQFYEFWQSGITFEELKAGKDGYVKLFAAWFQFPDSRRDPLRELGMEQCVPPDKVEEVKQKYGLDDWQIAWMQWAVREECSKDWDTFCEDYPFDAETAFLTSGRRRFNLQQIEKMCAAARLFPPALGCIDKTKDGLYLWRPCAEEEARVVRWEAPKEGLRYLISVDQMTGETQVGGLDPDNHAVGVIRAGYMDVQRGWVPPKLVARLVHDWGLWERNKKYELRWEIDVLEEEVWRLAQYYGNALIVPEMNMDRGIVELLKLRQSAQIYLREQFNRRDNTRTRAYGWKTDQTTREMAIENLARAIRERGSQGEGVEIYCPVTLDELKNFITKSNGRSEAMPNKHDDTVLQMAIGMMCLSGATSFVQPRIQVKLPPDLQRLEDEADENNQRGRAMRW